jgi:hypothetical protein
MNGLLLALLAVGAAQEVRQTGPRIVALQQGRVVQVWPSAPPPAVIVPHARRPAARPFGPHPGETKSFRPEAGGDPFDARWTHMTLEPRLPLPVGMFLLARPEALGPTR